MKTCHSALAKIGHAGTYLANTFLQYLKSFQTGDGWMSLPKAYLNNEYITADSAILTTPSNSDAPVSIASACLSEEEDKTITDDIPRHEVSILTYHVYTSCLHYIACII